MRLSSLYCLRLDVSRVAFTKRAQNRPRRRRKVWGATHAREAIETALQQETEAIDKARKGDDPAGDLAALANMANEARQ